MHNRTTAHASAIAAGVLLALFAALTVSLVFVDRQPIAGDGSKCWMRANKANIQHAATKITNMPYWEQWLRLLFLNELNSNYVRCFGVPACA